MERSCGVGNERARLNEACGVGNQHRGRPDANLPHCRVAWCFGAILEAHWGRRGALASVWVLLRSCAFPRKLLLRPSLFAHAQLRINFGRPCCRLAAVLRCKKRSTVRTCATQLPLLSPCCCLEMKKTLIAVTKVPWIFVSAPECTSCSKTQPHRDGSPEEALNPLPP